MEAIINIILFVLVIGLTVYIGAIPGRIAKARKHRKWESIRICGFVGCFLWPCYLIAYIWAYSEDNRRAIVPSRPKSFDPIPDDFMRPQLSDDAALDAIMQGSRKDYL